MIPNIPLRTTNVVRGIVQIEDGRPTVSPPPIARAEQPTTLTEDDMFSTLDKLRPGTSERLIAFLVECEDLQVSWEVKKTLIIRMVVGAYRIPVFVVATNGTVDMGYASGFKEVCRGFARKVAESTPGAEFKESAKACYAKGGDGRYLTIWDLLDHKEGIRSALETLNETLHPADSASSS